jgi:hypothetical protein
MTKWRITVVRATCDLPSVSSSHKLALRGSCASEVVHAGAMETTDTASCFAGRSTTFCQHHFQEDQVLRLLGHDLLQPAVLVFELTQSPGSITSKPPYFAFSSRTWEVLHRLDPASPRTTGSSISTASRGASRQLSFAKRDVVLGRVQSEDANYI